MMEPLKLDGNRRALLLVIVGGSKCARLGAPTEIQETPVKCPNCGRVFTTEDALDDVPYIDFYASGGVHA